MNYKTWSYRFADQVLNSNLKIKNELDSIIQEVPLPKDEYKRKALNTGFSQSFVKRGWEEQFAVFNDDDVGEEEETPLAKIDFIKDRVGVEWHSRMHHSLESIS